MAPTYNLRSPTVKRIMQEMKEIQNDPYPELTAQALEDNIFEWHFVVRGAADTEFEGGIYHGRILLPAEYPFKPPSFIMLTPNGRFETGVKVCLSISSHHPEHWQPSWSVRTALVALIAFMPSPGNGAIGSLDYSKEERIDFARKSRSQPPVFGSPERQRLTTNIHAEMLRREKDMPSSSPRAAASPAQGPAASAASPTADGSTPDSSPSQAGSAAEQAATTAGAGAGQAPADSRLPASDTPAAASQEHTAREPLQVQHQAGGSAVAPADWPQQSVAQPEAAPPDALAAPPPPVLAKHMPQALRQAAVSPGDTPGPGTQQQQLGSGGVQYGQQGPGSTWEEMGLTALAAAIIIAIAALLIRKVIIGSGLADAATTSSFM